MSLCAHDAKRALPEQINLICRIKVTKSINKRRKNRHAALIQNKIVFELEP